MAKRILNNREETARRNCDRGGRLASLLAGSLLLLRLGAYNAPTDADAIGNDKVKSLPIAVWPHGSDAMPDGFLALALFGIGDDVGEVCWFRHVIFPFSD